MSSFCAAALAGLLLLAAGPDLPDPTRPPRVAPGQSEPAEPRRLHSILVSPRRRVAVIDDAVVREGDRVGGDRVVRITRDAVRMRGPTGEFTLRLTGPAFKSVQGGGTP